MAPAFLAAIGLTLALAAIPLAAGLTDLQVPSWSQLSPQQKEALAPLAEEWNRLDDARRRKWLGVAASYPRMTLDEQQRLQSRMRGWADLSPEERSAARTRFKSMQKVPPEQRDVLKQKWGEYDSLPDEEKHRLKREAPPRAVTPGARPGVTVPIAPRDTRALSGAGSTPRATPPASGTSGEAPSAQPQAGR